PWPREGRWPSVTSFLRTIVALPEAYQAVRRVENDDDQHHAENELPCVCELSGRIEADDFKHGSPGKRTKSMRAAAEDRDEHELARLCPVAELRRGDLLDDRHQRAANTTEERGNHIADEKHAAGRCSKIFQPRLVRLDGPQHMPERAVEVALHAEECRYRDQQAHIEDDVLEGFRCESQSQQTRTRHANAVRAVGVVEHLLQ